MTKQEEKGISGWKPATKEDLSEDEWDTLPADPRSEEDKALVEGTIKQEDLTIEDAAEPDAVRWYRHFSQFDTYDLEMTDGKVIRYTHMYPTAMQVNELELLRAQVGSGMDENEEPLNLIRQHHLKELWYDKLAEFYLFNTKTKKPMTHAERLACKDFWHSQTILKSCLWRTNNDIGPRGKNFDLTRKHP